MDLHPDAARQEWLWARFAEHFDDIYAGDDPTDCVNLLLELAPAGAVLELGAGTGRVALPLAEAGREVVAIEVAAAMAEHLRARSVNLPIEVIIADMVTMPVDGPFALVVAVDSSLYHVTEQARQLECVRQIARVLQPGGVFVTQAYVPPPDFLQRRQQLLLRNLTDDSVHISATVADTYAQKIRFQEITLKSAGNRLVAVEERFIWPSELDLMAKLAGLEFVDRWAGFNREHFDQHSFQIVSVYRKPLI